MHHVQVYQLSKSHQSTNDGSTKIIVSSSRRTVSTRPHRVRILPRGRMSHGPLICQRPRHHLRHGEDGRQRHGASQRGHRWNALRRDRGVQGVGLCRVHDPQGQGRAGAKGMWSKPPIASDVASSLWFLSALQTRKPILKPTPNFECQTQEPRWMGSFSGKAIRSCSILRRLYNKLSP